MGRKENNIKIIITGVIVFITLVLLVRGGPTNVDEEFDKYLTKKDIGAVLIGTLISNIFADNISRAPSVVN